MSMVFVPPTLRPPSIVPGGCTIPMQGPMPHFEAMPLDGMTMPMAMQPNLNNPCLLRQLRMPMQSQMVSKAPMTSMTWEASEDTLPPLDSGRSELRSSLVQDGDEFMMLLDSLEERVELMSKMQETRKRLQEVREPKKEPEAIEDGGYQGYRGSDHLDEQEESGAQLLLDQLQHLSPTSDAPRWCQPDLLQQDAQHPAGNGEADMADRISAADFRKLVTELERHLQESARLREDLQMEREESARLREELQMEREETARLRQELQMEREESMRLRQKHQQAVQDWMHEKAIFQSQINEMQKRLEKMAKSTSSGSSPGGESGSSGVVRVCTLRDMSTDPLPNQAATNFEAVEGFSLCGSNIAMSEDRMVATRSRGSRQSMVLGSAPIQKISAGWYYEVRLCEVESRGMSYGSVGGLGIGVTKQSASQSIRIPDKAWRWPQTSILGYWGSAFLEGAQKKIEWCPDSLTVGSIVGLLVTNHGDIQVLVDNEVVASLQGAMTLEPETELYPVLDIYSTTLSVELLRPVWSEGSRSASEGASESSAE